MQQRGPADERISQYSDCPQNRKDGQQDNVKNAGGDCLESLPQDLGEWDYLQDLLNDCGDVQADTTNQCDMMSGIMDRQRANLLAQQGAFPYNERHLRGFTNNTESYNEANVWYNHCADVSTASYNTHQNPHSSHGQRSSVTSMSNEPAVQRDSQELSCTPYGAYRGLFKDSGAARGHRHLSTRFDRQPYINPEEDPSIKEVEHDRLHHVGRIYDAMVRGDRAQDNAGSIAVKRWVSCAHYKPTLIEAFAHKVFDCLLDQVKEGFRGWHHNDYVDDERKGEKEDREVDCIGRLDNIIDALEREKTICEDVVNSASQIRMFVNAPIAYAARKYQNRLGNSKRGRANATDSDPRSVKIRRTGTRHNRARSNTIPRSRDTTPKYDDVSESVVSSYLIGTASKRISTSSTPIHLAPRLPLQRTAMMNSQNPSGRRRGDSTAPSSSAQAQCLTPGSTMSPPMHPASASYNAGIATLSPLQNTTMQTLTSPTLMPSLNVYNPAPPPPNNIGHSTPGTSPSDWLTGNTSVTPPDVPIDPILTTHNIHLGQQAWPKLYNQHPATHVSLADIEKIPEPVIEHSVDNPVIEFESLWNAQDGVQPFSFGGSVGNGMGHY